MFVYYFVHLDRSFDVVEAKFLEMFAELDGIASAAYRDGEKLRVRVGIGKSNKLAKTVRIHVGEPLRNGIETAVPFSWDATGTPGLFPHLDGEIVVASIGSDLTQLTLRGSYSAPFGALGRAFDRALLHRVAEASVKGLVDRIVRALEGSPRAHSGVGAHVS